MRVLAARHLRVLSSAGRGLAAIDLVSRVEWLHPTQATRRRRRNGFSWVDCGTGETVRKQESSRTETGNFAGNRYVYIVEMPISALFPRNM